MIGLRIIALITPKLQVFDYEFFLCFKTPATFFEWIMVVG